MTEKITIKIPDIGDFSEVEVIEILVQPGQMVKEEDGLITLETDKAALDVPAPQAGKVIDIALSVGDKVSEGNIMLTLEVSKSDTESAKTESVQPETAVTSPENAVTQPENDVTPSAPATVATPTITEIKVPNLGDFDNVEVIEVNVKAGDKVELESALITLETDKAAMDVPSPVAGIIKEVMVATGDRVSEGQVVAMCEVAAESGAGHSATTTTSGRESASVEADKGTPDVAAAQVANAPAAPSMGAAPAVLPPINESTFQLAHASPAVRKFARELGVDLGRVTGRGVKARIRKDDIKAFVKAVMKGGAGSGTGSALPSVPTVDFAKYGEIELQPLTRVQKISGPRLHASWVNIPHVTHQDFSDFTETDKTRKAMKAEALEQQVKLTPLAFVLRACVLAIEEFPLFNSSLSADGKSIVLKKYINLGFAADTPNGLVVPVIHNAQKMSVMELARALGELSGKARDGKLKAAQMQGATFTISSLGGIGGVAFTPIINAPEVAILGVSRAQIQPVYTDNKFVPRLMLPLSLSYDHRVIDGAKAARFTVRLAQLLADSKGLLAE